ncbi:DUF6891 domain-containing protein [Parenemella sanctibonifatiensis]|uniref:DUF6891 domain-containing protein n=1 Tax=Parenemella sanctibonifatiensis TaxID=2016505 RepID=A0A255ED52_9ACTN|nr:hypothetical protein [Parenemella sanctibonifatiensis]OYN89488.1 hypothetical protein CGZ91_11415 [Parenemella sanctibonifatiensis]
MSENTASMVAASAGTTATAATMDSLDRLMEEARQRILTGEADELEDVEAFLAGGLTGAGAPADEDSDPDDLAAQLWSECYELASEWEDLQTDVDRLADAFEILEDSGVQCRLFSNWDDVTITARHRGAVLVSADAWRRLSPEERRPLTLTWTGGCASDRQVAKQILTALEMAGLQPTQRGDDTLTVPVLWRWHVDPLDDDGDDDDDD